MPGTAAVIGRSGFRIPALLLIAVMALAVGWARRFPKPEVTTIKVPNPAELQRYILSRKPDVAQFKLRGPFAVTERKDLEIPLASGLTVTADLYLCAVAQKAPLVIVLHGYDNSKRDHAFQAMHLASWACMPWPSTCPITVRGLPTAELLPGWSTRFIGGRSSSTSASTRTRSF